MESKALKLYLAAYRTIGVFHEAVPNQILDDFVAACEPRWIEVTGYFSARGGINITIKAQSGKN